MAVLAQGIDEDVPFIPSNKDIILEHYCSLNHLGPLHFELGNLLVVLSFDLMDLFLVYQ